MRTFAKAFLLFVGLEYVALGVIGLVALLWQSNILLTLCGLAISFLLVVPHALTFEKGIQAHCFGQLRARWGCNLDTGVIEHARAVLATLCVVSITGGLLGI